MNWKKCRLKTTRSLIPGICLGMVCLLLLPGSAKCQSEFRGFCRKEKRSFIQLPEYGGQEKNRAQSSEIQESALFDFALFQDNGSSSVCRRNSYESAKDLDRPHAHVRKPYRGGRQLPFGQRGCFFVTA